MNDMKVTIFQAKKTRNKVPFSPTNDKKFEFEVVNINTLKEGFDILSQNFMLNISLFKNVNTRRDESSLRSYFVDEIGHIILDIDAIPSASSREIVLKYFRDNKIAAILGESRSPYNLKGLLRVNIKQQRKLLKNILSQIQTAIGTHGNVDMAAAGYGTYQAPMLKNEVLYYLEDGNILEPTDDKTETLKTLVKYKEAQSGDIVQICKNRFIELGFRFEEFKEDKFICSHYSEVKTPKGFWLYPDNPYLMHHWNESRRVNIFKDIVKTPEYKKIAHEENLKSLNDLLKPSTSGTNIEVEEKYLHNHKDEVKQFLDSYKLLKIQSPMGTAKSSIIEEVINQSKERELRVLLVTNRISLADDISNKYEDIKHYLDFENPYKVGDNLVVQFDSLFKYSTKYFDVCIIDEIATLLLHSTTETHNHKINLTKLFSLHQKKLVLSDAFMIKTPFETPSSLNIINNYRDETEIVMYDQVDNWVRKLSLDARKGMISVSSNTLAILDAIELKLKREGLRVFKLTSETPNGVKKLIYKAFQDKNNDKWDAILWSPTLTVGVSNINNVISHWHYDSGGTVDVIGSLQMLKRSRNTKQINIFLKAKSSYNPTNLVNIQDELQDYTETDYDGDIIGLSKTGVEYSNIIRAKNILVNNHQEAFVRLLSLQFNSNIIYNKHKVETFVGRLKKEAKALKISTKINALEEYNLLSSESLIELEEKGYNTTEEERIILALDTYAESLGRMKKENKIKLLEAEIKEPGSIEKFLKFLQIPDKTKYQNWYKLKTLSKENKIKLETIGYKIRSSRMVLNPLFVELSQLSEM